MRLPKSILSLVLVSISLPALASNGLTEAGEARLGGTQATVLRNGEAISLDSSYETYGQLYLAPEPASLALLICLLALRRSNR